MSTTIQHLIVHRLLKAPDGRASLALQDAELPVIAAARRLVEHLTELYGSRMGKGFGRFEDDETAYPMPGLLRRHAVENSLDFVEFSRQLMAHLRERAEQELQASGGPVLVTRVAVDGTDCLFVAVLGEVDGFGVNGNMQIEERVHLEASGLRVAGRVDIAAWQAGGERYVSFLRGRGEPTKYFKLFLGCNDEVTQLKETQKLVRGLEQFAQTQQMVPEARDELFGRAHGYLETLGEDREEVDLAAVAEQVWPDAPQRLHTALMDENLGLSGGFVPDRRAIKPLMRFRASGPAWKLEFDRASLRSGAVYYDKSNDTLVLSNIPEPLRKALLSE